MANLPPRGVYAPVVAFFHEDESLDLEALKAHVTRLAKGGVAGLVIQGSNGEAPHLLHSERQEVIATAAGVLKEYGQPNAVIIAGCGAQSTRETVQLCKEAKESGAQFALVLSPSYWSMFCLLLSRFEGKEVLTQQLAQCKSQPSPNSSTTSRMRLQSQF